MVVGASSLCQMLSMVLVLVLLTFLMSTIIPPENAFEVKMLRPSELLLQVAALVCF